MKKPATTFAVRGAIDPEAARRIASAVRQIDPAASVVVSLSRRIARVQSSAPVEQIHRAIAAHGFVAERSTRFYSRPLLGRARPTGGRAFLAVVGRAFRLGLLFALMVPLITFGVVMGVQHLDGGCGGSGGCSMELASATLLSIAPGAAFGFLIGLVEGIVRP